MSSKRNSPHRSPSPTYEIKDLGDEVAQNPAEIKVKVEDEAGHTGNKSRSEWEERLYLAVIAASVESIHKTMSIGQIVNQRAFFESCVKSSLLLAEMYVEAFNRRE